MEKMTLGKMQPFNEVINILQYAAADQNYRKNAQRAADKEIPGLSEAQQKEVKKELLSLFRLADKLYKKHQEALRLFALREKQGSDFDNLMGEILLPADHAHFAEITEDELRYLFSRHFINDRDQETHFHEADYEKEGQTGFGLLFEAVEDSPFSPEEKLDILKYIRNLDTYYPVLQEVFGKLEEAFLKLEKNLEAAVEAFAETIRKQQVQEVMSRLLERGFSFKQEQGMSSMKIYVLPSLVYPFGGRFVMTENLHYRARLILSMQIIEDVLQKVENEAMFQAPDVLFKTLGDPSRWRIMEMLASRRCAVKELVEDLGSSSGTVSHHLNLLHSAGLVSLTADGRFNYYRVNKETLKQLGEMLLRMAENAR